jgi:radical SAM additional 4Fe4S-binding domain
MLLGGEKSKVIKSDWARPNVAHAPRFPYHFVWLATNACNARCVHCSSASGKRRANELDTAEAIHLFDAFARLGVLDVAISGGEPLLRSDIYEIIGHAIDLGIRVGLGSNGSTINQESVRRLRDLGLHRLQISLDGTEDTHDTARCWPGLYKKVVKAIRTSLDGGLRTHVCCTLHRMNYQQLPEMFAVCVSWGVHRLNLSRFVPTGRGNKALDLSPTEWRNTVAVCEELARELEGRLEVTTHMAQMILSKPELGDCINFCGCQAGRGQGCIGCEGEVMPCVVLPIVIGNVRDVPLEEIWATSPIIRDLQDRSTLVGLCAACRFRERCGGCRGVAYSHFGDFRASDPRCWLSCSDVG